jgi:hypothetical protein
VLDARGNYPARLDVNQRAGTMLVRDLQGHAPSGTYTVLYDGERRWQWGERWQGSRGSCWRAWRVRGRGLGL